MTELATEAGAPTADGARGAGSNARSVLRGGGFSALSQFVPLVGNLALTPFVIHRLGLERYGLYILVVTMVTFLGSFDGGIGVSAQRYFSVYAGTDDRRSATRLLTTLLGVIGGFGVVAFVTVFFLAPDALALFRVAAADRAEGAFLFRVVAVLVALSFARGLFAGILASRQRFGLSSLTTIGIYGVYLVGTVYSLDNGYGLRGIAVTFAAQAVLSTALIVPAAVRYLDRRAVSLLSWPELRDFMSYAVRAQAVGLSGLVNAQADTIITGGALSVSAVGRYSPGANFATTLRGVPLNAVAPISVILSQSYGAHGDGPQTRAQFDRLQRLWVLGITGWCTAGMGACWFGITAWLGGSFGSSGTVAVVLTAGNMINLYTGVLTVYLAAVGRPGLEARFAAISVIANLALTVPFALAFGLVGIVAATALGQLLGALIFIRLVHRRYDATVRSFFLDVPVLAGVVCAAVTVGVELVARPIVPHGVLGLLASGLPAGAGLAVFAVLALGPRRARELAGTGLERLRAKLGIGGRAEVTA